DTQPIGTTISLYGQIKEQITATGTTFSEKHLFQSDMLKPCEKAEISANIAEEVLQAITFLNKLVPPNRQETLLDKYATSFLDRYEEREIPLAQLLDGEMGLELRPSGNGGDMSPLLDGIPFGIRQQEQRSSHFWSGFQSLLHQKLMEAQAEKYREIVLTDDDVKNVSPKWDDLPHTIAAMCEIFSYSLDGDLKLYLHSIGGSGAANLLGRFCHVDDHIHKAVMEIVREEEQSLPDDKLYAEIAHLPESRTGNILARPVLRQYEISYLAKPGVEKEFQLDISDLMVSVKKRKFILRSKRLNKEIIPRLTTAHNYSQSGAMPLYQFLCSLSHQHKRSGVGLYLSGLFDEYPYLPRIVYKNTILSLARWHVKLDEIKQIVENKETTAAMEALKRWKARTGIPRFVVLPDGDNELFIDTESLTNLRMLYSVVKKRPKFTLREFPIDMENSILKKDRAIFTNEFLFIFHKQRPV
ncbi:MAG: lantibiotic dehydratase family protein, partial [Bacteroidales bacterium]|nr:lantibiotic dehydratase family protein [Bacteroidales bacterium]